VSGLYDPSGGVRGGRSGAGEVASLNHTLRARAVRPDGTWLLQAYATATGTKQNVVALRRHGWGFVYTPDDQARPGGADLPYFLDNGAWGCFCKGHPFDPDAFRGLLAKYGAGADFVVVPDIVGGGRASLDLSRSWLDELLVAVACPILIPVQEGMTPTDFDRLPLGARVGLFVGGAPSNEDTRYEGEPEWKELTLPVWGTLAREAGCWLHVGRVNTARRIHLCLPWAHSFDGTSASKYAKNVGLLDRARKARVAPPFRGPRVLDVPIPSGGTPSVQHGA